MQLPNYLLNIYWLLVGAWIIISTYIVFLFKICAQLPYYLVNIYWLLVGARIIISAHSNNLINKILRQK